GRARDSVIQAINFWQSETCINFRPRTNERQFVEFIGNDDGCWSTVGKDEAIGRQVVSIGRGCEPFGVTSHELAHSLGVFHEQSRYDRDAVVQLNRNVVDPNLLFNFAKIGPKELNTYGIPYDVGSVMHYTPTELVLFSEEKL
ncbi:astacin, partial [Cooperia oncophora]